MAWLFARVMWIVVVRDGWLVPIATTLLFFLPPEHWYWSVSAGVLLCIYAACIARRARALIKEATRV